MHVRRNIELRSVFYTSIILTTSRFTIKLFLVRCGHAQCILYHISEHSGAIFALKVLINLHDINEGFNINVAHATSQKLRFFFGPKQLHVANRVRLINFENSFRLFMPTCTFTFTFTISFCFKFQIDVSTLIKFILMFG